MKIVARKPLMLKEYLELDDDDDGCYYNASAGLARAGAGVGVTTTIRCLLDAELRGDAAIVERKARPNRNALTKFSAAINAVKLLAFASSDGKCMPSVPEGSPSSNFSERLRGSLWTKKKKRKDRAVARPATMAAEQQSVARLKDIVRSRSFDANGEGWRSLRFPSPVASSRSSWSETESSGSDFLPASMVSSESPHGVSASGSEVIKKTTSPGSNPNPNAKEKSKMVDEEPENEIVDRGPAKEVDSKVMEESGECSSDEEEKEQLSPVSVIDYPYQQGQDDDNNNDEAESTSTTSPTFYRSLDSIERTKEKLLNRIRRFEMLADLDAIDLERCSPSSDAEDPLESTDHVVSSDAEEGEVVRARDLLGELNTRPRGSIEKLLLDFFIQQGQSSRVGDANRNRPMRWDRATTSRALRVETGEMLNTARDWIDGRRCRELDDRHGEATLREMERNGRWRCFHEEEDVLAVHVEGALFESLVEELVQELASR